MKKVVFALVTLSLVSLTTMAQIKKTSTGTVTFDATTPSDDWPKATNNLVNCAINTKTGKIEFKLDINNFSFKDNNAKIKEHWLDAKVMNGADAKMAVASFSGKIADLKAVNFTKDGDYAVSVAGNLTIHGVKKAVTTPGTVSVKGTSVTLVSNFTIKSIDYGVSHPAEGAGKVSKTPSIALNATLK